MEYKNLQQVLLVERYKKMTNVRLNSSKQVLQAEYDRLITRRAKFWEMIDKFAAITEVDREDIIRYCREDELLKIVIDIIAFDCNMVFLDLCDKIADDFGLTHEDFLDWVDSGDALESFIRTMAGLEIWEVKVELRIHNNK